MTASHVCVSRTVRCAATAAAAAKPACAPGSTQGLTSSLAGGEHPCPRQVRQAGFAEPACRFPRAWYPDPGLTGVKRIALMHRPQRVSVGVLRDEVVSSVAI